MLARKGILIGVALVAVAGATIAWTVADNDDDDERGAENVALTACPPAVQQTINAQIGAGTLADVEKKTGKDGAVFYEAKFTKPGEKTRTEALVSADGKLIKVAADDDDDDDDDKR